MWELNCEESWAPKNWCFWTMVLEKTLESPLDCKEIQPVHPKGDQSWLFIGGTDEAETPILWPPDVESWLIWKHPDAGKDWRQEKKVMTEDEMVGWHHWLNGWTLGVGNGQGSLVCCSSWGRKESDTTELLNWTEPPGKPSLRKVTPHLSLSVGVQDPNFKKGHPHTHTDGLIALNYLHPKSCNNLPLTHPVLKAQTFLLFQCSWAQSWNEVSFTYYSSLNKICTAIFNKRPVQFQSDTT